MSTASHAHDTAERSTKVGSTTARRRTTTQLPELVDIETLAANLDVGVRLIRRLVTERRIPFVKVGRFVRFDTVEVVAWLDRHRIDATYPRRGSHRGW